MSQNIKYPKVTRVLRANQDLGIGSKNIGKKVFPKFFNKMRDSIKTTTGFQDFCDQINQDLFVFPDDRLIIYQ